MLRFWQKVQEPKRTRKYGTRPLSFSCADCLSTKGVEFALCFIYRSMPPIGLDWNVYYRSNNRVGSGGNKMYMRGRGECLAIETDVDVAILLHHYYYCHSPCLTSSSAESPCRGRSHLSKSAPTGTQIIDTWTHTHKQTNSHTHRATNGYYIGCCRWIWIIQGFGAGP